MKMVCPSGDRNAYERAFPMHTGSDAAMQCNVSKSIANLPRKREEVMIIFYIISRISDVFISDFTIVGNANINIYTHQFHVTG